MDTQGYIEIRISGKKGNADLSPDNFDISEIRELISSTENILFPGLKRNRPTVSFEQLPGSVRARFKTKAQVVLGFAALLGPIKNNPGLEFLEIESARGIEALQVFATSRNYEIELTTSSAPEKRLLINSTTNYHLAADVLIDADFYFYGEVSTVGGKKNPSLHIDTSEYGVLTIKTSRETLEKQEDNLVYKVIGVHAKGKQSVRDFEIDRQSLELVELLQYNPLYDKAYLDRLINRAASSWVDVKDVDLWLRDLRGGGFAA